MVSYRKKSSASGGGICVTSNGTARVLRKRAHVQVDSWEVDSIDELGNLLEREEYRSTRPITHVILHTPNWDPRKVETLALRWPDIEFVQHNHSGLSYLDLDHNGAGIGRIRQYLDMQDALQNVRVAANNRRTVRMFYDAFGKSVLYLPNLYYWEKMPHVAPRRDTDPLRIGSFGVARDWKNQPVAAEAAMSLGRRLNVFVELHTNIDPYNTYIRVRQGRQNLVANMPGIRLIEHPWMNWTDFRRLVASMDLLLSPSYDETFCNVCADGIVEGVPSVGTDAMEWLPMEWRCREPFDQASVFYAGLALLHDRVGAIHDGRQAIEEFVSNGTRIWVEYLTDAPQYAQPV